MIDPFSRNLSTCRGMAWSQAMSSIVAAWFVTSVLTEVCDAIVMRQLQAPLTLALWKFVAAIPCGIVTMRLVQEQWLVQEARQWVSQEQWLVQQQERQRVQPPVQQQEPQRVQLLVAQPGQEQQGFLVLQQE